MNLKARYYKFMFNHHIRRAQRLDDEWGRLGWTYTTDRKRELLLQTVTATHKARNYLTLLESTQCSAPEPCPEQHS